MKKTFLFIAFALGILFSHAQFLKPAKTTGSFVDSLTRVLLDYPGNFAHLLGKPLPSQGESDMFQSRVSIPGATHCYIVQYHSAEDNSASWQAILYTGDSYATALRKYKSIFAQIKNTEILGIGSEPAVFTGQLEKTDENVRFATSSLRLKTTDKRFKNFVAEVEMTSSYEGWEVHVNLYTKKAEEPEE